MIVYRNPRPEQMGEVLHLRWNVLRDPELPLNEAEVTDIYDADPATEHGALYSVQFGVNLVSTGRIHTPVEAPETRQIRYMATQPTWRGKGLGTLLLRRMEELTLAKGAPVRPELIWANARIAALSLYEKAGYAAVGKEFSLVGVPHVRVEKPLQA